MAAPAPPAAPVPPTGSRAQARFGGRNLLPVGTWLSLSWDSAAGGDRALADPAAIYAQGEYHVYGTTGSPCVRGGCAQQWVPRFSGATLGAPGASQGDAMPDRPAWVSSNDRAIWAPAIARINGAYVMYFSATSGRAPYRGLKCIGAAISGSPTGPFVPLENPLVCTSGFWNVDPAVVGDGGTWYLLWRRDDEEAVTGRIVGAALSADGLSLLDPGTPPVTLLAGESGWEDGYTGSSRSHAGIGPVENPAMARHPATGQWLLTWSANRWESGNYATGLAACASPLGPCLRVSQDSPWLRTSSDRSISTSANFSGSGGMSFVTGPDGNLYAVFHAYPRTGAVPGAPRVGWAYRVEAGYGYVLREF